MAPRKILISGGAGFIGSAVIRHILHSTQFRVVNLDKLTYAGNLESLSTVSMDPRYAFEKVDICDTAELTRVFKQHQPDIIMHLAAESHVDRSIDGPAEFVQTNIFGTYNLLEASRAYWNELDAQGKQDFRFHHISTDEVYGDLPHPDELADPAQAAHHLFTETTAYAPSSPYSASKASSDHLVRAWHRTYGLPIVVTNCSNNYGPYHFPEKLIPLIIKNILEGKKLPVYGDGTNVRDWLYVEDHCKAIDAVIHRGRVGEVYNVGGHNEKQNIEIVRLTIRTIHQLMTEEPAYRQVLKKQERTAEGEIAIDWINDSLISFVKDRLGHDQRYAIDPSKINRELGWLPETSFEVGIVKTIRWYLEHQDWVEVITGGDYMRYYERMYQNR